MNENMHFLQKVVGHVKAINITKNLLCILGNLSPAKCIEVFESFVVPVCGRLGETENLSTLQSLKKSIMQKPKFTFERKLVLKDDGSPIYTIENEDDHPLRPTFTKANSKALE